MKGLTVTRIVKEINGEGVWGDLEAKNCFQRQSFTKYLRLTLAFMRNSALREKFLRKFFDSINKIFILAGKLGTRLLFYEVLRRS